MERKPKYKEVVDWVKERLEKKELSPGDKLNSENELCELFGLSRQTVRHAIAFWKRKGLLPDGREAEPISVTTGWPTLRIRREWRW